MVGSACSGGQHISHLDGLQAIKTIDDNWGACLRVVDVTVTHGASASRADEGGKSGLLMKLFGHANFFVTAWGTPAAAATPADDGTRNLIARAEQRQPDCAGKASGLLPASFGNP